MQNNKKQPEIREILRMSGLNITSVAECMNVTKEWVGRLLRRDQLDVEHEIRILDAISELLQRRYTEVEECMMRVERMYKELEG